MMPEGSTSTQDDERRTMQDDTVGGCNQDHMQLRGFWNQDAPNMVNMYNAWSTKVTRLVRNTEDIKHM